MQSHAITAFEDLGRQVLVMLDCESTCRVGSARFRDFKLSYQYWFGDVWCLAIKEYNSEVVWCRFSEPRGCLLEYVTDAVKDSRQFPSKWCDRSAQS